MQSLYAFSFNKGMRIQDNINVSLGKCNFFFAYLKPNFDENVFDLINILENIIFIFDMHTLNFRSDIYSLIVLKCYGHILHMMATHSGTCI